MQNGEVAEARGFLEKALDIDPGNANALQLLGATYLRDHDIDKGIGLIQRALAVKPDHVGAFNNLGYGYFAQEKFSDAAIQFERSLALKPENPPTTIWATLTPLPENSMTPSNVIEQLMT